MAGRISAMLLAAFAVVPLAAATPRGLTHAARVEVHLAPQAYTRPHVMLMTLGGTIYCGQIKQLAAQLNASRLCADYPRNRQFSGATRAGRMQDWGDPAYLDYVATLPDQVRKQGVKISKLILVGVSYSGFAVAELAATHPEMHPDAVMVLDSFFDLTSRYRATREGRPTRREMTKVMGGSPAQHPEEYVARSPSSHLDGLAGEIGDGTRVVVAWSIAPAEKQEFYGATCARNANARWLAELATITKRPVVGYVSRLVHSQLLHQWGTELAGLAGIGPPPAVLPVDVVTFQPGQPPPRRSYCGS